MIVDDHQVVRSGLRRIIEGQSPWKVCGEAADGGDAIQKAISLRPDVVLMDISMPVMNGIEATRRIRQLYPPARIVIVSLHDDKAIAEQAKDAGAHAYFVKAGPSGFLLQTIADVLRDNRRAARGTRYTRVATSNPAD